MNEAAGSLRFDPLHVAIDGPAGSGKSTVAAQLARRLGLRHVETGAMYRALTLLALRESIPTDDGEALSRRLDAAQLRLEGSRLLVGEEDVSEAICLALEHGLRGVFNVVGPGEVPLHTAIHESGGRALPRCGDSLAAGAADMDPSSIAAQHKGMKCELQFQESRVHDGGTSARPGVDAHRGLALRPRGG